MGIIRRDSRGYALSLDLLLALIPLTIILGMVGADMDNMLYNVQDTVFRSSMDRVATDTVNALVSTSGTPLDWEKSPITNSTIIGLAYYDINNRPIESSLSASKFTAAKVNAQGTNSALQRMVGTNYGFFVNVTTVGDHQPMGTIGNQPDSNAKDIVRIERVVLFTKYASISSLKNLGPYIPYTVPAFNTSYNSTQNYDYWILMAPATNYQMLTAATLNVNGNTISFSNNNITTALKINDYVNSNSTNPDQSLSNTITLSGTGSSSSLMNLYIIQTATNVSSTDVTPDTVSPKTCRFVFYLWAK
ncbi:MAG: hypothetical protein K8E24_005830 [Methanobacterium paludis]|nr:hypothetical protein [Methanobacterium paludis]